MDTKHDTLENVSLASIFSIRIILGTYKLDFIGVPPEARIGKMWGNTNTYTSGGKTSTHLHFLPSKRNMATENGPAVMMYLLCSHGGFFDCNAWDSTRVRFNPVKMDENGIQFHEYFGYDGGRVILFGVPCKYP